MAVLWIFSSGSLLITSYTNEHVNPGLLGLTLCVHSRGSPSPRRCDVLMWWYVEPLPGSGHLCQKEPELGSTQEAGAYVKQQQFARFVPFTVLPWDDDPHAMATSKE